MEGKNTHKKPRHSYNQNQKDLFPGAAGSTPSPHPALLWEVGWEPEEEGREGGKEEGGEAEPVREEAALGLTAWGLSLSPKPAHFAKFSRKEKPQTVARGNAWAASGAASPRSWS